MRLQFGSYWMACKTILDFGFAILDFGFCNGLMRYDCA
jgi:hypothetical protein